MSLMSKENRELMDKFIIRSCSDAELERRWNTVAKAMEENNLDYLVVAQRSDYIGQYVKWFTDQPTQYEYPATAIFSKDKELVTIWSGAGVHEQPLAVSNAIPYDWCSRGITRRYTRGYFPCLNYTAAYDAEIIVNELAPKGAVRIGLVGTAFMTVQCYKYIVQNLTKATIVDATDIIDEIKAVKSPEEIKMIRETCQIHDEVLFGLRDFIKPGMREIDIYAEMRYQSHKRGAENGVFLVGSNNAGKPAPFYHEHFHSNRVIEKGDTITVLLEPNGPSGMYGHITAVYSLGDPTDELIWCMDMAKQANDYLISMLKPGTDCVEILDKYNEWLLEKNLPPESRLLGHGQGYCLVERPAFVPGRGEKMKLKANMNISSHPIINTEKAHGVVCANYLVKESGPPELLHRYPTEEIYVIK